MQMVIFKLKSGLIVKPPLTWESEFENLGKRVSSIVLVVSLWKEGALGSLSLGLRGHNKTVFAFQRKLLGGK